jgi:cyclopropane fatty-acyl-phospholipid synthase-like methyltransferase
MDYKRKIDQLIQYERSAFGSKASQQRYLDIHAERFSYTVALCKKLNSSPNAKVLDVGRSSFSYLLADHYEDVTTLGFPLKEDDGGHRESGNEKELDHLEFDLNQSRYSDKWPKPEKKFDLIVYAETIEHIHTAPEFSLLMLRSLLSEEGKLIITTPNAAAFHKRIRMLLGANPYEKIRFFDQNPGHFREYTMEELTRMAQETGFKVEQAIFKKFSKLNPFASLSALKFLPVKPFEFIPRFKDNLVIVLSKNPVQAE